MKNRRTLLGILAMLIAGVVLGGALWFAGMPFLRSIPEDNGNRALACFALYWGGFVPIFLFVELGIAKWAGFMRKANSSPNATPIDIGL